MNIKERIAQIRDKAAKIAVKSVAVATLLGGAGTVSSCTESNRDTENKEKIENIEESKASGETKTSVVFRSTHQDYRGGHRTDILCENGDRFTSDYQHIEAGDTITYESDGQYFPKIKAVRYKDGSGKHVNFDENNNKYESVVGTKTSVVFRSTHQDYRGGHRTDILCENGDRFTSDYQHIEAGDTITYESDGHYRPEIKAVRYKDGSGKNVNFGKIGKDITD